MKTVNGVPGVTGTTPELPEIVTMPLKVKADYQRCHRNEPAYKNKRKKYVRKHGQK